MGDLVSGAPPSPFRSGIDEVSLVTSASGLAGGYLFQALAKSTLLAQRVSDCQDQVAPKIVCGFAARFFDPVVTCTVSKLPILEFTIAVLNDFDPHFPAEKTKQGLGLSCATGKNDDRAIVFYRTGADRFLNAIAHSS
jgi:hypothetical protein